MNSNGGLSAELDQETRPARSANDRFDQDPILPLGFVIADLGCSKPTFYRVHRRKLEVIAISTRRRGVLQSIYRAYKARLPRV